MSKDTTVIREVAPGVTIFSVPFKRGFLPLGGRSTAVKLSDGGVWLLASHALDASTRAALDALGPVHYVVSCDNAHSLFLSQYKDAYPEAKLIGVSGHEEKLKSLKFDGVYGKDAEGTTYGYEDEIHVVYFPGHAQKDVAFFHVASKTLIEADLLFNLPARESFSKTGSSGSIPLLTASIAPGGFMHKTVLGGFIKDKASYRTSYDKVLALDFARIVPCHGDVIEKDAKAKWQEAYKPLLG
ncbi:hypothetical protein EXIGLDRAFT_741299 [Exidia glandulosa HHB12029]|uniref:Metallo-beta-lactamase domain-containing protein n=1 Tax=Exidia glandulosa HHB12029 TaxID=1314781 RepID=A0A165EVS2_EXIGL|nr:hypothetical protein EXIGLDRAFT_741299 [Exidia glandulosa HHB12029]